VCAHINKQTQTTIHTDTESRNKFQENGLINMYTKKKIDNFGPFYLITKFKKERIKNVFIKN